jgi:hypothetical protein
MGGIEADDGQQLFEMQRCGVEHQELDQLECQGDDRQHERVQSASLVRPDHAMLDVANAGVANVIQRMGCSRSEHPRVRDEDRRTRSTPQEPQAPVCNVIIHEHPQFRRTSRGKHSQ